MDIKYRKIELKDYLFLREMLYEALFVPEAEDPLPKSIIDTEAIKKYIEYWGKPGDFGIIAEYNNILVGAIWGRLFTEDNQGYGFVDANIPELSMAVIKEYRNMGIGTVLMKKFIHNAINDGYKAVSLSVDKRSRAVSFYKKACFKIVNEIFSAYTMLLEL